jgi:hypothetical protein
MMKVIYNFDGGEVAREPLLCSAQGLRRQSFGSAPEFLGAALTRLILQLTRFSRSRLAADSWSNDSVPCKSAVQLSGLYIRSPRIVDVAEQAF